MNTVMGFELSHLGLSDIKAFFSWYSVKKNLMVLIFALSMVAYVINGVFGLYSQFDELAKEIHQ